MANKDFDPKYDLDLDVEPRIPSADYSPRIQRRMKRRKAKRQKREEQLAASGEAPARRTGASSDDAFPWEDDLLTGASSSRASSRASSRTSRDDSLWDSPDDPLQREARRHSARTAAAAAATAVADDSGDAPAPRRRDKKKASRKASRKGKRSPGRRIASALLILVLAAILITIVAGGIFTTYAVMTADEIDPSRIYDQLETTSILYDDEGNRLEDVSTAESRTIVTYDQLSPTLINAFVAIEDKTFFKHKGFNIVRIIGALRESVFSGGQVSGTSTITQQLARNLYLGKERTMTRKIQEAYYTIILERELSKEDIITAYLNTISLGYHSCGVQAAAQAYFGMDAADLSVAQCAVLASIPKSPLKYAPLKQYLTEEVTADEDDILAVTPDGVYTIVYNDAYIDRQHLVLENMHDQNMINEDEYIWALDEDIRVELVPSVEDDLTVSSYFTDYCVDEVKHDLMTEYDLDEDTAENMVYNGGLRIYTTLDVAMQETAEAEFERNSNFPGVQNLTRDRRGNILNANGNIMLYSKSTYFNDDDSFTLSDGEFYFDDAGNLVIEKGHRLNIYITETENGNVPQIEFKDLYFREDGIFYTIRGGYFKNLDADALSADEEGNAIVSAEFLAANPDFFQFDGTEITVLPDNFLLRQNTIQPQGAMVITDYSTGQIKVMVGGRSMSGRMLYNRANNTRQPGSSIKPIAVYGPALQSGLDLDSGWTAGTTVKDEKMTDETGKVWPTNWYHSYRGYVSLRTCVEQSINTTAVKVLKDIGLQYSLKYLKANGITSVVEEGRTNDMNAAALALGGMTNGISPIQMASAYGTFPNGGEYIEPTTYTKVEDNQGNVILDSSKTSRREQVYDEGIAWIMTSILQSTVTDGIAGRAEISSQPVGGKTGTTTDNYDAWFVGFTPQYAASVWIGNDVNIELSNGSGAAASLWSRVMEKVCRSYSYGSFRSMPDNVYKSRSDGEYYVDGTTKTGKKADYESGDRTSSSSSSRRSDEDDEDQAEEQQQEEEGDTDEVVGEPAEPSNGSGESDNSGSSGNSGGSGGFEGGGRRDYNDSPQDGLINDV